VRRLLHLGRSDHSDPGLIAFKEHLGAQSTEVCYYRTPAPVGRTAKGWPGERMAGELPARMPDRLLEAAGEVLYRHLGRQVTLIAAPPGSGETASAVVGGLGPGMAGQTFSAMAGGHQR
jgi:hypothetical protein